MKKKVFVFFPDGVGLRNFAFTDFKTVGENMGFDITYWNNAGFFAFNHTFNSWGTEPKALIIKFGAAGAAGNKAQQYCNKNSSDGYTNNDTKQIGITIMEIAQ